MKSIDFSSLKSGNGWIEIEGFLGICGCFGTCWRQLAYARRNSIKSHNPCKSLEIRRQSMFPKLTHLPGNCRTDINGALSKNLCSSHETMQLTEFPQVNLNGRGEGMNIASVILKRVGDWLIPRTFPILQNWWNSQKFLLPKRVSVSQNNSKVL